MFGLKREDIYDYVEQQYGTKPEYLWKDHPTDAVLRHENGKWFAVFMNVGKEKLGLPGIEKVDIMNVKCTPELVGMLIQTDGVLPGYHMNKEHWISVLLDGTVRDASVLDLLDMSYDSIDGGKITK